MKQEKSSPRICPDSSSHLFANVASCAIFFTLLWHAQKGGTILDTRQSFIIIAVAMLPMALADILRLRCGGMVRARQPFNPRRVLVKLTGLYGVFALILGLYWLFPEYHATFYTGIFSLFREAVPWLMLLAIPYIALADRLTETPEDGHWHFGMLLAGAWSKADRRMVVECLKAWFIKAFFLPLMATYLVQNIQGLRLHDLSFSEFMPFYDTTYTLLFTIDLLFACTGYMMTFRPLGTQIQSAEPTVAGWVACLMCYSPIWPLLFYPTYFNYDDNYYWDNLTAGNETLRMIWGSAILGCLFIYAWATVAFGYRFSNLTYRGLISNGPYAFTKHPAYLFKCLSWWLISVPFISSEGAEVAVRHSLMLAGVCLIYFVRARTEENHLSNYPEYVAYAEWINEHGLFRHVGRWIPYLRYSRERAMRSGSRVYAPFAAREVTEQASLIAN